MSTLLDDLSLGGQGLQEESGRGKNNNQKSTFKTQANNVGCVIKYFVIHHPCIYLDLLKNQVQWS